MNARVWIVGCMAIVLSSMGVARAEDEKISIDQAPAAVKSAIVKEVEGGKINKIEKDTYGGKTVYEVEYMDDGKVEEAAFTEDGKSVAEDADDKDGDKDESAGEEKDDGEDKD